MKSLLPVLVCLLISPAPRAAAWDYEGHRVVNQLALEALPPAFPAFVRAPEARERIAFLGGEMDRWRNVKDLATSHYSGPDHYFDLEEITRYGLKPGDLEPFRYDFLARLALIRAANPEKFPPPDPARNEDRTRELPGLLPWALAEAHGKLKSSFSYLKAYQHFGGTPEEIRNAEQNIITQMGIMGHLAADASQPLHTTVHHHGWVGPNPHGYTTNRAIHQWIDGGFFARTGGIEVAPLRDRVQPAQPRTDTGRGVEIFRDIVDFLVAQNALVEPLYQMDKAGKLGGEGDPAEGRAFLERQLVLSAQLLADLWLTAYLTAPEDTYLKGRLTARRNAAR